LKKKKTALLHIHYWGDCDESWYRFFFDAADKLDCRLIENINTPVAAFCHNRVNHYVFVSGFASRLTTPPPPNSSVIYPGSDFSLFSRNGSPIPDNAIGMVYRLEPDKLTPDAIDVFIEVVKSRPHTRCYIIGGGTYLEPYRERVKQAGLSEHFVFTGYVPYKDLPEYYKKLSLFVAPVWKESFGQVSPFAMSMEIPVVGYDIGALSEILGGSEQLARTTEELKEIICGLLDNREKRIEIGAFNRKRALENFSVDSMVHSYKILYNQLVTT
jgi:glycosyltransferase involved in cell wall biosynthesis